MTESCSAIGVASELDVSQARVSSENPAGIGAETWSDRSNRLATDSSGSGSGRAPCSIRPELPEAGSEVLLIHSGTQPAFAFSQAPFHVPPLPRALATTTAASARQ